MEKKEPVLELIDTLIPFEKLPKGLKEMTTNFFFFRKELLKESDRGCALLAASYIDSVLEVVLRNILCGSKKHLDSLFSPNGPLGSFSSRILVLYSIGFLSKNQLHDIQAIRKIRNEFGHSPKIISFADGKIKSLCDTLKLIGKHSNTPKEKFITCVGFITGTLEGYILSGEQNKFKEREEVDIQKTQEGTQRIVELAKKIMDI